MKAKTPILLLTVMLMVSSAFAVDPVEWSPVFVCGNAEIFPSMLIAVANVKVAGKDRDMIGIRIVSPSNNCRVKIELRADSIMDASDAEQTLPVAGHEYTIFPSINWRYDALAKVRQTIPLKMSISISIDGQAAGEMHQRFRCIRSTTALLPLRPIKKPWIAGGRSGLTSMRTIPPCSSC